MAKANKKLEIFLKIIAYAGLVILFIIIILFLIRFLSPREIDDVTPGIQCDESLLSKSDVLWVIPAFDNKSIAENRSWCNYILSLNKTLGMHGVYHNCLLYTSDAADE